MLLSNTCKIQLLILFYFLQFGVDSIYGEKNALYMKFVSSDGSLEESFVGGKHAHLSRNKLSAG